MTIVVIGSSNIDLIMKMDHLPRRGESVTNAEFMQTFGGKGANQAVAAARAGGKVVFVNCVGDDAYGQQIIANMRRDGINADAVFRVEGASSGTALIMIGPQGENYLSIAPGANYRLMPEHLEGLRGLIAAAEMVVLQCEITPEALDAAIHISAEEGRRVMLNLAPARPIPAESLARLHILAVNETEAEFLCGFAVQSQAEVERAADALLARGPRLVVITLGAGGCWVAGSLEGAGGGVRMHVPAFKVQAVDTTAAGDVFCGALAVALCEGRSLLESVRFASAASAISVTRLGAQPSIPTRVEIEAFLR